MYQHISCTHRPLIRRSPRQSPSASHPCSSPSRSPTPHSPALAPSSHHASFLPRPHGRPQALSIAISIPGPLPPWDRGPSSFSIGQPSAGSHCAVLLPDVCQGLLKAHVASVCFQAFEMFKRNVASVSYGYCKSRS
jgi:hypothetical protein